MWGFVGWISGRVIHHGRGGVLVHYGFQPNDTLRGEPYLRLGRWPDVRRANGRATGNSDGCLWRDARSTGLKGRCATDAGMKTRVALPWGDEAMHAEHDAGKLARQRFSALKGFKGGLKLLDQLRRGSGLRNCVSGGRGEVVQV